MEDFVKEISGLGAHVSRDGEIGVFYFFVEFFGVGILEGHATVL